jgi:hypothetical protein
MKGYIASVRLASITVIGFIIKGAKSKKKASFLYGSLFKKWSIKRGGKSLLGITGSLPKS